VDPIEAFFDMLAEAVDRDAARQDMEERKRSAEQWNSNAQKRIDEFSCRMEFTKERAEEIPALEKALELGSNEINGLQAEIDENTEKIDLLKHRLAQSRGELTYLLRQIYNMTDTFLNALDETGKLRRGAIGTEEGDITVPKSFAGSLRMAADCSKLTPSRRRAVTERREQYLKSCESVNACDSPGQRARRRKGKDEHRKRFEQARHAHQMQCEHQDERQRHFLRDVARPFLIANGYMHIPRSPSGVSSVESVVPFPVETHPKGDWSEQQEPLELTESALRLDPAHAELWQKGRKKMSKLRADLDDHREKYARRLEIHLYAFSNSTKAQLDKAMEPQLKMLPDDRQRRIEDDTRRIDALYARVRNETKDSAIQDLLLSPSWAGSGVDVAPSQASTLKPFKARYKLQLKDRDIKRWNRGVTRAKPVGKHGSPGGKKPKSGKPAPSAFAELPSPTPSEAMGVGEHPSMLSPTAVQRRLRRLSANRTQLRRQVKIDGGPT
jgi:hypothetical protein